MTYNDLCDSIQPFTDATEDLTKLLESLPGVSRELIEEHVWGVANRADITAYGIIDAFCQDQIGDPHDCGPDCPHCPTCGKRKLIMLSGPPVCIYDHADVDDSLAELERHAT